MPVKQSHSPRTTWRVMVAVIVASMAMVAVAENVVVRKTLDIKPDKDPLSDAVETVNANTQLQVLGRENGWVHVKTPSGKEGFISQDDLPANTDVSGLNGSGASSGLSTSAAGKGLEEDSKKYSQSKNLKTEPFDTMIAWGEAITSKDLKEFDQQGHVGSPKHR